MAATHGHRHPARDTVVRPISRASGRPCARPGCPSPAASSLVFSYGAREAQIVALLEERAPEAYDLCGQHAERTTPPHGWTLIDRRPADGEPETAPSDEGYGGADTVAVLAAALRGPLDGASGARHDPVGPDRGAALDDLHLDDLDPDDESADLRLALEELAAVANDHPGGIVEMRRPAPTSSASTDGPEEPGRPPLARRD
jgi:hypothetical protein